MRIKIIILLIIVITLSIGIFGYFYIHYQFDSPADVSSQEITFIIKSGEGVKQIARHLENDGLIRSSFYFEFYVWKEKLSQKLQALAHLCVEVGNFGQVMGEVLAGLGGIDEIRRQLQLGCVVARSVTLVPWTVRLVGAGK